MSDFETVTFGSNNAVAHVLPGSSDTHGAIICLQEWWGVNDGVRAHARKLRDDLGVTLLIPDLYRGALGVDVEEAHHLMSNLDWGRAATEICEAAEYLRRERGAKRVGVIGFCMGGALTLIAGAKADVDCVAPFYGIPGQDACDVASIKIPVQGHFGMKDNLKGFSDPEAAAKLGEKLVGSDQTIYMYEDVGHAFMNVSPEPYPDFEAREKTQGFPPPNEAMVSLAWKRVEEFFRKYLSA